MAQGTTVNLAGIRSHIKKDRGGGGGALPKKESLGDTKILFCGWLEIFSLLRCTNRPRSIYQYSNMGPRLSGLTSIFGVVFFVSKSPVGIERQKKLEKCAILTRKPRSHA